MRIVLVAAFINALSATASASVIALSSYHAATAQHGDGSNHAMVAVSDGTIREVYWRDQRTSPYTVRPTGIGNDILGTFSGVTPTRFAAMMDSNGAHHVFMSNGGNSVFQFWFVPGQGIQSGTAATTPNGAGIVAIAAFYSAGDGTNNLLMADTLHKIWRYTWGPTSYNVLAGTLSAPITGMTAYYTNQYANWNHIQVRTGNSISEILFLGTIYNSPNAWWTWTPANTSMSGVNGWNAFCNQREVLYLVGGDNRVAPLAFGECGQYFYPIDGTPSFVTLVSAFHDVSMDIDALKPEVLTSTDGSHVNFSFYDGVTQVYNPNWYTQTLATF